MIAKQIRERIRKRKVTPEMERCYGCDKVGYYIAECPFVICFCCKGEGHQAPECPWNPNAKAYIPITRWAPARKARRTVSTLEESSDDTTVKTTRGQATQNFAPPVHVLKGRKNCRKGNMKKKKGTTTVLGVKSIILYTDVIIKRHAISMHNGDHCAGSWRIKCRSH